ncbi:MAG: hypothetical protein NVS3B27_17210 [Novosphingobium sp.]
MQQRIWLNSPEYAIELHCACGDFSRAAYYVELRRYESDAAHEGYCFVEVPHPFVKVLDGQFQLHADKLIINALRAKKDVLLKTLRIDLKKYAARILNLSTLVQATNSNFFL